MKNKGKKRKLSVASEAGKEEKEERDESRK